MSATKTVTAIEASPVSDLPVPSISSEGRSIMDGSSTQSIREGQTTYGTETTRTAATTTPITAIKKRSGLQIATIMIALNLTLFVGALNDTVLANAIPSIATYFNSATGYFWIGGAHSLAKAATGPLWVKFSDIWGRKPILLTALALFFVGSSVCGWATSMEMLIAGRVIQGVAGGGLFGMIMIVIADIFSMRARTLLLGLMAGIWAIAGATGPILGGALTQLASWRWCFYINLPTAGLSFVMLSLFLDVHNPRTKFIDGLKAIDWLGSLFIVAMVLMIMLGLDFGGVVFPWNSPTVICLLVFGALCSVLVWASEKYWAKYPVIPLRIFSSKSNVACLLVICFQNFTFIGAEYYLPLYFQSVKEASPLESGVLTIPLTVIEAVAAISTGLLVHKIGRYQELMWVGTFLMTLGNGLYINLGASSPTAAVVLPQIVAGLGVGTLFDPPMIALQAGVAQGDVATACATAGIFGGLGSAISIVIGGVIFQNGMALQKGSLEKAGLPQDLIERIAGVSAAAHIDEIPLIKDMAQRMAAKEAIASSMRNMWIMYTCVAFLAFIASLFIRRHHLSREHTETRTGLNKDD